MTTATPPKGRGPLARREARLAWGLLLPTLTSVMLVVILPLLAIFWISVKPVNLSDLRAPAPVANEQLRGRPAAAGRSSPCPAGTFGKNSFRVRQRRRLAVDLRSDSGPGQCAFP